MSAEERLVAFVQKALAKGQTREQVGEVLAKAGWSAGQVRDALGAFADVPFPIAVPKPRASSNARDAFVYGVLFLTMYLSAYHLGLLLFALIEHAFPSGAHDMPFRESMRWGAALLVVSLPIYLLLLRHVNAELKADPGKRLSDTRRQLTWLTLFVCACVLLGVAAGLVYELLGGELTLRFVLKSAVLGGIAGGVFKLHAPSVREEKAAPA